MSVSAGEIVSGIAVSSSPVTSVVTVSVGVSATGSTVTSIVSTVEAVSVPSVDVAVTVRVKSTSLSAGGVTVRPESCAGVSVQMPPPWSLPADKLAPAGTPETVTARLSEPSVSVSAEDIVSGIAASSSPVASATVSVGASATGSTVTLIVSAMEAVSEPSVEVAVTVRVKSTSLSDGGVIVSPASWAGVSVQIPPP